MKERPIQVAMVMGRVIRNDGPAIEEGNVVLFSRR